MNIQKYTILFFKWLSYFIIFNHPW